MSARSVAIPHSQMAEAGAACADAAEEIDFLALQRTLPTIDGNKSINQNLVEQHLASKHKKKKKKVVSALYHHHLKQDWTHKSNTIPILVYKNNN